MKQYGGDIEYGKDVQTPGISRGIAGIALEKACQQARLTALHIKPDPADDGWMSFCVENVRLLTGDGFVSWWAVTGPVITDEAEAIYATYRAEREARYGPAVERRAMRDPKDIERLRVNPDVVLQGFEIAPDMLQNLYSWVPKPLE